MCGCLDVLLNRRGAGRFGKQLSTRRGASAAFLPAHLPPAEGEKPRECPGGRAQTQLLLQPSAAPGLGHLLPSAAKPSVSGIARRWHLPGEVGNASRIRSSSLSPALLFVGGRKNKNQSPRKPKKALGISVKMLGSFLENHCSIM